MGWTKLLPCEMLVWVYNLLEYVIERGAFDSSFVKSSKPLLVEFKGVAAEVMPEAKLIKKNIKLFKKRTLPPLQQ